MAKQRLSILEGDARRAQAIPKRMFEVVYADAPKAFGAGPTELLCVPSRRASPRCLPAGVVHPRLRISLTVACFGREHKLWMFMPACFDHRLRRAVQDDEALGPVLHVIRRNDEDGHTMQLARHWSAGCIFAAG